MEQMFLDDLEGTTEIVLDDRHRPRPTDRRNAPRRRPGARGSAGRAAAGDRRVLGPVEARIMTLSGFLLLALAVLFAFYPRGIAYPLVALLLWLAVSLIFRGGQLFFERRRRGKTPPENSDLR